MPKKTTTRKPSSRNGVPTRFTARSEQPLTRVVCAARRASPQTQSRGLEFARKWGSSIFVLALLALLVHDVFGSHGLLAMLRARTEVQRLRGEIVQIAEENRKLAEHVRALRTDPKLIERIARDEMNLSRPGELIFKVPPRE